MALFKRGVLSNQKSKSYYRRIIGIGLTLGTALTSVGIVTNFRHNWTMEYSLYLGSVYNYAGSVFTSLGYIGLIMMLSDKKITGFLLQKVGRMAFSGYLLQTILCTSVFYGFGLGLFGTVDRTWQILFVLVIWVFLIAFSRVWLKHFKYGPFEWLWMILTYGKIFAIRN